MTTEPWQAFYDEPDDFLPPAALIRWRREEQAMRAEEQRLEAERAERAEIRQELAMWNARQYTLVRGLPWDPARPFQHVPDVYARADSLMALQDREQRDADRRALQDAGLHHLVADLPHPAGPEPSGEGAPPALRSMAASGPGVRHRYGLARGPGEAGYVRLRLRRFLDRVGRRTDR
jgi:hypothetical protein